MTKVKFVPYLLLVLICASSCTQKVEVVEEELPAIPEDLPKFEVIQTSPDVFNGYIFLRKISNPGIQFMIDTKGSVVWQQQSDTAIVRVFKPYEKSYLSLYRKKELHEISYNGDTLLNLNLVESGFDRTLHHEVFQDSKGRIVGLTNEKIVYDLTRFGGEVQDTIITDGIVVLSRSGEKIWHWTFDKVLDTLSNVDQPIFQIRNDWAHANAIFEDTDGNYVVSWRDLNQVWKINSTSGEVMWKYGGENPLNEMDRMFQKQHGVHKNLDGDYMVFDNLPSKTNISSRAVAFNNVDGIMRNTLEINLPDSIFTQKEGSVYQIEKDKFLFCVTRTNDLIITNREGEILWHAKGSVGFYRAYYLEKSVLD